MLLAFGPPDLILASLMPAENVVCMRLNASGSNISMKYHQNPFQNAPGAAMGAGSGFE